MAGSLISASMVSRILLIKKDHMFVTDWIGHESRDISAYISNLKHNANKASDKMSIIPFRGILW